LYAGDKRLGQLGILIVIGVALGRVAAGVHYPSDILGGALVGLASFAIVRLGHKALRKKPTGL
jgi:membrane-associated phospholipid phosphatase